MSILDAASTLLALRNALPAMPPSAASNELTTLVLVINQTEEFASTPVHLPPIQIRLGRRVPTVNRKSAPPMTMISPFYNPAGYLVMQTLLTSARLKNIVHVDRHANCMGTIAWITEASQYDGIALRMLINSILEHGDVMLLFAMIPVWGCSLLVTWSQIHSEMTFRL